MIITSPETVERVLRDRRQARLRQWAADTFIPSDPTADTVNTRARRFLEEALELAQAAGVSWEEVDRLVTRAYGRQPGDLWRELGQVSGTLAILAETLGMSLVRAERAEAARVMSLPAEHWQARDRAKLAVGL